MGHVTANSVWVYEDFTLVILITLPMIFITSIIVVEEIHDYLWYLHKDISISVIIGVACLSGFPVLAMCFLCV